MLTTILLVAASLVIGFGWGVVLTIQKYVLPLRKAHEAQMQVLNQTIGDIITSFEVPSKSLDDIGNFLQKEADGSIVSPIQIKRD